MDRIAVERWSFWSPEAPDPASWLKHWDRAGAVPADLEPPAANIPAMQRRRMSRLSKMAVSTALDATAEADIDYSIFCSQHGELVRTRQILASISQGEEISPAAFAQSVHNTASGLYTILRKSTASSMSMSSGASSFACGWLEAQAWLARYPRHRVLLVDFDEVIPADYRGYTDQVQCDHALALVLRRSDHGLEFAAARTRGDCKLPHGPQFLAWLQGDNSRLTLGADGQGWQWAR